MVPITVQQLGGQLGGEGNVKDCKPSCEIAKDLQRQGVDARNIPKKYQQNLFQNKPQTPACKGCFFV